MYSTQIMSSLLVILAITNALGTMKNVVLSYLRLCLRSSTFECPVTSFPGQWRGCKLSLLLYYYLCNSATCTCVLHAVILTVPSGFRLIWISMKIRTWFLGLDSVPLVTRTKKKKKNWTSDRVAALPGFFLMLFFSSFFSFVSLC